MGIHAFKYGLIILLGLLLSPKGYCQSSVSNDNIENRLPLSLNQWHASQTDGCTVQWNCVDEALTGKCIDYHNDQWFSFTTSAIVSSLYINIAKQACRDVRGVQLVVIDGTPCQTTTYQILACVSLANQDDIYVQLDSLKPNHTYLLNVDGYLHDYCRFQIQVSGQPQGMPMNKALQGRAKATLAEGIANLSWTVDEDVAAQVNQFEVFRRHQKDVRSTQIRTLDLMRNAAGNFKENYQIQDSLSKAGLYTYKVIGLTANGGRLLIGEYQQNVTQRDLSNAYIYIPLPYRKGTSVTLLLYDESGKRLLDKISVTAKENNPQLRYFVGYFLEKGIRTVFLQTINNKTGEKHESVIPLPAQ